MFDIVYLKKTGQIIRTGYFGDSLVLSKDEDKLSFDSWVEFESKAVRNGKLVASTEKNAYRFRGQLGEPWEMVRTKRDALLSQTDHLMMPDSPISSEYRLNLAAYRQALRDITAQTDPASILWPESPQQ